MGSRSRERDRSRSPLARSKHNRDDERRGKSVKSHHVKKEYDDHDKRRHDPPVKSEPNERVKPHFKDDEKRDTFGSSEKKEEDVADVEKPNMALSGALMEDTNVFNGVVIK